MLFNLKKAGGVWRPISLTWLPEILHISSWKQWSIPLNACLTDAHDGSTVRSKNHLLPQTILYLMVSISTMDQIVLSTDLPVIFRNNLFLNSLSRRNTICPAITPKYYTRSSKSNYSQQSPIFIAVKLCAYFPVFPSASHMKCLPFLLVCMNY